MSKFKNYYIISFNYYQVKKLRLFLTSVQSNIFVSYFACNEFGRFNIFIYSLSSIFFIKKPEHVIL